MGPRIELWDTVGLGLIISWPSGVTYSNQTGGTSCLAPEFEGVFVPLCNECSIENHELMSPANELEKYFMGPKWRGMGATKGLDEQDADYIDSILSRVTGQWGSLPSIRVNRERSRESHEAWVYVIVHGDEASVLPVFAGFDPYPRSGVLTWQNSD